MSVDPGRAKKNRDTPYPWFCDWMRFTCLRSIKTERDYTFAQNPRICRFIARGECFAPWLPLDNICANRNLAAEICKNTQKIKVNDPSTCYSNKTDMIKSFPDVDWDNSIKNGYIKGKPVKDICEWKKNVVPSLIRMLDG